MEPIEFDPQVFTQLALKLGLTPLLSFHDIPTLDSLQLEELSYATVLLLPISGLYQESVEESYTSSVYDRSQRSTSHHPRWFSQRIKNSCGLMALINIMANLPSELVLRDSLISELIHCYDSTPDLVDDRVIDVAYKLFGNSQNGVSQSGETDEVGIHFIVFVKHDGLIYELDGRRNGPVLVDMSESDKIQLYMDNTPDEDKHKYGLLELGVNMHI